MSFLDSDTGKTGDSEQLAGIRKVICTFDFECSWHRRSMDGSGSADAGKSFSSYAASFLDEKWAFVSRYVSANTKNQFLKTTLDILPGDIPITFKR